MNLPIHYQVRILSIAPDIKLSQPLSTFLGKFSEYTYSAVQPGPAGGLFVELLLIKDWKYKRSMYYHLLLFIIIIIIISLLLTYFPQ